MRNKKIIFGTMIFLFVITGICSIQGASAFTDDIYIPSSAYMTYGLGYLNDGDIIEINEIHSSGVVIDVYIMNDEQLAQAGGLVWYYTIKWDDISSLSGLTFDIVVDDDYYIVLSNTNIFIGVNVHVDVSVEYKAILITSPIGSSLFESGYNWISWTFTGNFDYVIIDLYKNGNFLETIISGINNDGSYEWYIYSDEYTDSSDYQIKISDYDDANTYDYSSYFNMEIETKTILITSPISSSVFESGYSYITWTTTGSIDYIIIDLYKNGNFLETIDSYDYNDGSYSWYIYSDDYTDSSDYQIKIRDYDDGSVYDYSDWFDIDCETELPPPPPPPLSPPPPYLLINIVAFSIIAMAIVPVAIILIRKHKRKTPKEEIIIQERVVPKIIYCSVCGAEVTGKFCNSCGFEIK